MERPDLIEQAVIETYMEQGFNMRPNIVFHIYKVRRGKFNKIKVFIYFDYDCCRAYDCFVTDDKDNIIDIPRYEVEVKKIREVFMNNIKEILTTEQIVSFMEKEFDAGTGSQDKKGNPIFKTVCHNGCGHGSSKLFLLS